MAKQAFGSDKATVEKLKQETAELAAAPIPSITFTEAEVQKIADFVNFMYLNFSKNMDMKTAKKVIAMFNDMHAHMEKVESYIFEFKRTVEAKKAVG